MNLKRRTKLRRGIDIIDEVILDEQDAYNNMPEGIQDSEKGEKMEEGIDNLNEARDILEEMLN